MSSRKSTCNGLEIQARMLQRAISPAEFIMLLTSASYFQYWRSRVTAHRVTLWQRCSINYIMHDGVQVSFQLTCLLISERNARNTIYYSPIFLKFRPDWTSLDIFSFLSIWSFSLLFYYTASQVIISSFIISGFVVKHLMNSRSSKFFFLKQYIIL